jgi:hypothetical protein
VWALGSSIPDFDESVVNFPYLPWPVLRAL